MRKETKRLTLYGILASLAMVLSYVESQIPPLVAVPGMKLGITNIVVLVALYMLGNKGAYAINLVRIIVISMLFGTAMSFAFSIAGGMLSTTVMVLLKKLGKFSQVGVSCAGGISHNIGQIIIAMILLNTKAIMWYLPVLWITGIVSGIVIGIIGGIVCKHLKV